MLEENKSKKWFNNSNDFTGILSTKSGQIVKDLHIKINYSEVNEGNITGEIIGNNDTCDKLEFLLRRWPGLVRIESVQENFKISSNNVMISNLRLEGIQNTFFRVASLHPLDLNIIYKRFKKRRKKTFTFFLTGPDIIGVLFSQRYIKNRNGKWNLNPKKRYLGKFKGFRVFNSIKKFDDYIEEKTSITKEIICLQLQPDDSEAQFADNNTLIKEAKEVVDVITLLASFISNNWIKWYGYIFETEDEQREYLRDGIHGSKKTVDVDDLLVKAGESDKFFRKAFRKLNQFSQESFNIEKPIRYLIYGNDADFQQASFTTTFLVLEQLKDEYAKKHKLDQNLKKFSGLKNKIENLVREEIGDSDNIIAKIIELNRPPIKFVVHHMLKKYKVTWDDLYPDGNIKFFNIRNKLIHSTKHPKNANITIELMKMQMLMNRLLIKILNCDKYSNPKKLYSFEDPSFSTPIPSDNF